MAQHPRCEPSAPGPVLQLTRSPQRTAFPLWNSPGQHRQLVHSDVLPPVGPPPPQHDLSEKHDACVLVFAILRLKVTDENQARSIAALATDCGIDLPMATATSNWSGHEMKNAADDAASATAKACAHGAHTAKDAAATNDPGRGRHRGHARARGPAHVFPWPLHVVRLKKKPAHSNRGSWIADTEELS